jgi:hypothetical protein
MGATIATLKRCTCHGSCSRAGVKAEQYEPGEVPQGPLDRKEQSALSSAAMNRLRLPGASICW